MFKLVPWQKSFLIHMLQTWKAGGWLHSLNPVIWCLRRVFRDAKVCCTTQRKKWWCVSHCFTTGDFQVWLECKNALNICTCEACRFSLLHQLAFRLGFLVVVFIASSGHAKCWCIGKYIEMQRCILKAYS